MSGNVLKDSRYLDTIQRATKHDLDHPIHNGVTMQAHHALSEKGIRLSELGRDLVNFGYDINWLENLVFIPSTLQGACHLGVQPHRGDHRAPIGSVEDEDDEPLTYHYLVQKRVSSAMRHIKGSCPSSKLDRDSLRNQMAEISLSLIKLIQSHPARAPLTGVAGSFLPHGGTGCGGVDSVRDHGRHGACPVGRDHKFREGPQQRKEAIALAKPEFYRLRAGR